MHRLLSLLAAPALALGTLGTLAAPGAAAAPSNSDLRVVRLDPDPVAPGGTTTVHGFVGNGGPQTAASPFTVVIDLPPGFTPTGPYFPSACTVTGRTVSCTFPAGLPSLRSATALVPVRADAELPHGLKTVGQVRVVSADDHNPANNLTPFTLTVS
ncbi:MULTISPECIES: hypothetical protein [Kitasatospora]|uniref:DUF11 domain-containing protein n=1 Tax=Kitasatospora setae (strain ATCC 33774 / DSM 43861 / JCM 3304 / KCC A-0304 / NBRC 14216 / KM-6054) TaxID=452652 RepID=E4N1P7_KITSK|nr:MULTISPECIES: hypothetical protein [Kitasatospora]BAJ32081.1 hypothetical protein KSE_63230 [Kitasatospora setae KM-6054]